jgi:hypothetical protein
VANQLDSLLRSQVELLLDNLRYSLPVLQVASLL